ncbi:L-rhamnose mutarotase [Niabella drilacis]|uniref:L-rhamnose mutarotase n=1 Tax=Niabella drilacis (strain DSM 25811 / CCM 8410 / CCUG 62505 / LMG 26954 / E90) TaxID=1285928 RepID=A0A1G7BIH9_NIADE|nr:L-rhamnose mutarotase [Niabella drilacis]SDE26874.1 L-rhamnose mutarotase [Niabella drilacis]
MKRFCLTLDLKDDPGLIARYEQYHQADGVWPEIIEGIRSCGIAAMDIYRAGNRLMMILEAADDFDLQSGFARMATLPRQREWAALMDTFQQKLPFARPHEHWVEMKQIFKLYK